MQATCRLVGDALEDVGEPGLRVEVVELGSAEQRVHGRGTSAAPVRAAKQPRLSSQGDTAQRSWLLDWARRTRWLSALGDWLAGGFQNAMGWFSQRHDGTRARRQWLRLPSWWPRAWDGDAG